MRINNGSLFFVVFTVVYGLTACSQVTPASFQTTMITVEARPAATLTLKATVPTVKLTSTPTPLAISDNMQRECVRIMTEAPSNIQLTGLLMIYPVDINSTSYLLDLSTKYKIPLGNLTYEMVESEDRSLLAYKDLDTASVVIADNAGKKIKVIPDPDERLTPVHWLDNQRLMLNHRRGERNGPYVVSSLMILDISTGKMQEWLPDYPNLDTRFSPVSWSLSSRFIVNPQLTHLVYQAREGLSRLVMWDIKAKKAIANIYGVDDGNTPWWSPDGTRIVTQARPQTSLYININDGLQYINGGDLFTIDTMGNIKRLTYFTTTQYALENAYTWSPDGKNIAFMLQTAPDSNSTLSTPELSILNIETGHVTNLCIRAGGFIWSPDGKYILIHQGLNEQRKQDEAYIVDLENKVAWKVAENAFVEGWMVSGK